MLLLSNNKKILNKINKYVLPTYKRFPVALVKGRGVHVWDADGKKYLDFLSGIAVNGLGYSHPAIIKAVKNQVSKLIHTSNLFCIDEQARLAKNLVLLTGQHQAFFCNSGAEAIEASIKFARYWGSQSFQKKRRTDFIVTTNSFHGRTLGALSATSQHKYQDGFKPLVPGFKSVPFNDVSSVKKKITLKTCALLVEPIQGEGGVWLPSKNYLAALRQLCTHHGILLIFDEVQVGVGRTGRFLASQHYQVKPDIVALSKALGAGLPIGACLVSKQVAQCIKPGIHASTFGGNPLVCAAALESLKIIQDKKFLNHVWAMGRYFLKHLTKMKEEFPTLIKEVRGLGLLLACELRTPIGNDIVRECLQAGLILNAIDNRILRLAPPLIINESHIDQAVRILSKILNEKGGQS